MMTTRDNIMDHLRRQLEALKAARLAEREADAPKFTVYHEPVAVDYAYIAHLLVDALEALKPGIVSQALTELDRRYEHGYPPRAHRHFWQEIDNKPDLAPLDHQHKAYEQDIASLQAMANSLSLHVEDLSTTPVVWNNVQDKPETYPPERHTHPLPPDLVNLLELLYEQGKPGQVLVRTRDGVEWRTLHPQVVYQRIGGGSSETAIDNVIVDSEGTFLVDSSGTYVEAA